MSFVYHFKRSSMIGSILMPLNDLQDIYPETYENHAKKYHGREILMKRKIPKLNCLWNDVLHLSPINPQIILDEWDKMGMKLENLVFETYKIPIEALDESHCLYFDPQLVEYGNFEFKEEQFRQFEKKLFNPLDKVSDLQIKAWKKDKEEGRKIFWYSHTTHVLYKGHIDISEFNILNCR